ERLTVIGYQVDRSRGSQLTGRTTRRLNGQTSAQSGRFHRNDACAGLNQLIRSQSKQAGDDHDIAGGDKLSLVLKRSVDSWRGVDEQFGLRSDESLARRAGIQCQLATKQIHLR